MASIGKDGGGRKRILFVARDGRRKTIRLGRATEHQAATVLGHVENLVAASLTGQAPPPETSRWLAGVSDLWRKRLAAVGLAEGPGPKQEPTPEPTLTLKGFLDGYLATLVDLKPSTIVALRQTVRLLVEHFGPDRPLTAIRPGDADAWQRALRGKGLAEATVRRRCGAAKQFGKAAVRNGFLPSNPFADLKAGNLANPARAFYVDADTARKVLDACPCSEWKLIFGLCRFAGLRCPSEVLGLTWGDVHWAEGRFTVASPKTAHHGAGHESRSVPIVPELLPLLREAFEAAEPGAEYVIALPRYRCGNASANLATQLRRILWRAGVDPWPRIFTNLRASFDTDLAARYPAHLAARWLGHSPQIAAKHYLQVLDSDFAAASATPLFPSAPGAVCRAAQSTEGAAQKAAHSGTRRRYPALSGASGTAAEGPRNEISTNLVGDTGLEHPAGSPKNAPFSERGTESGTVEPVSPDVLDLAARLAALPVEARQALAAVLGKV